jgi:serine acetyltransferase
MFDLLREDISRAMYQARPDGWKPGWKHRIEICLRHSTWPVISYRYAHWTLGVRVPVIGQLLRISGLMFRKFTELFTSVHIDVHAKIGPGFVIHSVYAINLGKTTIGENFTIATGCLISHACRGIGDNVYFGPGSQARGRRQDWQQRGDRGQQPGADRCARQPDGDGGSGAHQAAGWTSAAVRQEDDGGSGDDSRAGCGYTGGEDRARELGRFRLGINRDRHNKIVTTRS